MPSSDMGSVEITKNSWIQKVELRYLLFTLICLGYFAYGCNLTLIGLAFQDLTSILKADSRNVSYGITIRYVVNCFAAILAGVSFNLFSRQLQYAASLFIYGSLMMIMPYIRDLSLYFMSSAAIGLVSAFIDCASNMWVFELFSNQVNFHILILHFSYSVGQILAPLIVRPYLVDPISTNNDDEQKANRLSIPFFLCSLPFLVASFSVLVCYCLKPYKPPGRFIESKDIVGLMTNDKENSKQESPLPRYYYNTLFVIISLTLGFEIANELNLNFYLPTYLNKSDLQIDKSTVSLMMVVVGLAYCVGRFFYILLALKVNVSVMICANLVLIVIGNLILTFFATHQNLHITWIAISLLALGYSTAFPCLFSYIESRITITNTLNSFLVFVTSSVFTVNSLVIGNSIDDDPWLFQVFNSTFSIFFVILFAILHSTDIWKKKLLENRIA